MALNFRQAMKSIHMRASEVTDLAVRGDDLALKTINYYRQAWHDFHKRHQDESKMDPVLMASLISTATEYLIRDMTISDLQDLQSKFGHRLPGAPKKLQ